jgi:hypothetical protein
MPSQKIPEAKPWQEIALESVPQNSANIYCIREDNKGIYGREKVFYRQSNCTSSTIGSPEDIDMASYYFSESDFLSSLISSRPSTCSPPLHKSYSFSIESSEPIIGNPCVPHANDDPVERHRRSSIGSSSHDNDLDCGDLKTLHKNGLAAFSKGLILKMKKVAGRPMK